MITALFFKAHANLLKVVDNSFQKLSKLYWCRMWSDTSNESKSIEGERLLKKKKKKKSIHTFEGDNQ